jgi:hypothetical protein
MSGGVKIFNKRKWIAASLASFVRLLLPPQIDPHLRAHRVNFCFFVCTQPANL